MVDKSPKSDHYLEPRRGKAGRRDLATEVNKICKRNKTPGPVEFMAEVLSGHDPRRETGELYELVSDIQRDLDETLEDRPTAEQWEELLKLVLDSGLYEKQPVPLKDSLDVAKELTKYLHPQLSKQQVQSTNVTVAVKPVTLTDDQVAQALEWFDATF